MLCKLCFFLGISLLSFSSTATAFAQAKTWGGSGEEFLRHSYEGALYDAVEREFRAQRRFEARCLMYRNIHEASRAAGAELTALNTRLNVLQLQKKDNAKTRRRLAKAEKEAARAVAWAGKRAGIARLIRIAETKIAEPIVVKNLPEDEEGLKAAILIAKQRYQKARQVARSYREIFCSEDYEYGCYPLVRGDPHPLPLGECSL